MIPFVFDQFYWGKRSAELGVGPQPIPFKKITVENLVTAIELGLDHPHFKQKAMNIGQKITVENGIENALNIILDV